MNNFDAKSIHSASMYLDDKLKSVKNGYKPLNTKQQNVYIVEDKKESMFQRFVGSIFQK